MTMLSIERNMPDTNLECKTRSDAYTRVALARVGSLHNTTPEYLSALRTFLNGWIEQVDAEIARAERKE